jgi:hypothetical protein
MKLPHAEKATVQREKIVDYLLNASHPDNSGKAAFFMALGFRQDDWPALAAAFRRLAEREEVTISMESPHGRKYVLDGCLGAPSGKTPWVRTVWIIDRGGDAPPGNGVSTRRVRPNYD